RALAMSSIFPALLPTSPPSTLFPYTTLFRSVFQPPESLPRPRRLVVQPHAMVAVRSPGTLGQLQRRARGMGFEVLRRGHRADTVDRKSTRLNSSHGSISYAVFCLKKKKNNIC